MLLSLNHMLRSHEVPPTLMLQLRASAVVGA
jgi:hypothetical protein